MKKLGHTEQVIVRMSPKLKQKFARWCTNRNLKMATVIRALIEERVAKAPKVPADEEGPQASDSLKAGGDQIPGG